MKTGLTFAILLLSAAALVGCTTAGVRSVTDAEAPRSLPEQGRVAVQWGDPAQFSEIRYSHNAFESRRGNWVEQLARHLRKEAEARLPSGQRLEVTFTDIDRAGSFEPWRGVEYQDTRVVRDFYPPRIELRYRLTDADGRVVSEGDRKLTDPGFLTDGGVAGRNDPLRFEKALIDRWLRREFGALRD